MKNSVIGLLLALSAMSAAQATTYNYVTPNGAYTYTMPSASTVSNAGANNLNNGVASGLQTTGQFAGTLAAATAARATGNPAAAMAAQSSLTNAGANVASGAVLSALGAFSSK